MKKLLFIFTLLLLIAPVIASNDFQNFLNKSTEQLKQEYNSNLASVPWIIKTIIGSERINFYLTAESEQIIFGAIMKKARILELKKEKITHPTLNVYVSEETINKIINKELTLQQALDTKEIRIESQRIRTSIKLWFAKKFVPKYF
jgi:hypothetical protein